MVRRSHPDKTRYHVNKSWWRYSPEGEFINSPSHWLGDTSTLCEQKPSKPKIESKPKRNDLSI